MVIKQGQVGLSF